MEEGLVEGKEFALRDEKGERRAVLGLDPNGQPFLALFDQRGAPRLSLGLDGRGEPTVMLTDGQKPGVMIRLSEDGGLMIWQGDRGARLAHDGLRLFDPDGAPILFAGLVGEDPVVRLEGQGAAIQLRSKQTEVSLTIVHGGFGSGSTITLKDSKGRSRVGLAATDAGGVIACHDENEEVVDAIGLPSS